MNCPVCGNTKTTVIGTVTDIIVERYRNCKNCSYSFLTVETVKADPELCHYKEIQEKMMQEKISAYKCTN